MKSVVVCVPVTDRQRRRMIRSKACLYAARHLRKFGDVHSGAIAALYAAADAMTGGVPDSTEEF